MCPFSSRTLNVRSGHIARDRCKVCRRSLPSPGADPGTQDFSPSPVPQPRRPPLPAGLFIGSSLITGEGCADLQEEVLLIAVPVGPALDDLDRVVDAFDDAGIEPMPAAGQDPV